MILGSDNYIMILDNYLSICVCERLLRVVSIYTESESFCTGLRTICSGFDKLLLLLNLAILVGFACCYLGSIGLGSWVVWMMVYSLARSLLR